MTTYYAIPATETLRDNSRQLLVNLQEGVANPQAKLFIEVAKQYTDEVVDALLLDMLQVVGTSHSSARIIEMFAGIIKATMHGLTRHVLHKMKNDDLQPLSEIIRNRLLKLGAGGGDKDYLCFALPDDFATEFETLAHAILGGEGNSLKLTEYVLRFSEMAQLAFYDDSLKPLKLGFLGHKLVDLGSIAIRNGSRTALTKIIPSLEGEDLKSVVGHFLGFLVKADNC